MAAKPWRILVGGDQQLCGVGHVALAHPASPLGGTFAASAARCTRLGPVVLGGDQQTSACWVTTAGKRGQNYLLEVTGSVRCRSPRVQQPCSCRSDSLSPSPETDPPSRPACSLPPHPRVPAARRSRRVSPPPHHTSRNRIRAWPGYPAIRSAGCHGYVRP